MALKRNIQPAIKGIDKIEAANPDVKYLSNGMPVYVIDAGDQEIIRLDIYFNAGSKYQDKIFQSAFTNSQLLEGTGSRTSKQIADDLDFYGSYLIPTADRDEAGLQLYSLNKFLIPSLEIARDVLTDPVFKEGELNILKNKRLQALSIEELKVQSRARKEFFSQLFGKTHPYGQTGEAIDVQNIDRKDLENFHRNFYRPANSYIILSGMKAGEYLGVLDNTIGQWKSDEKAEKRSFDVGMENPGKEKNIRIKVPEAVQSAIRIGKIMPVRSHEDFSALSIVNTILGGYFGSRLMQNIREDKGYTYGIGSSLHSFLERGLLVISTDVGLEYYENAIGECYREIERLGKDLMDDQELKRVIQYIEGELLRQLDGPFNIAESFKSLVGFGLDFEYLKTYLDVLYNISPADIRTYSKNYFSGESMIDVAAGLPENQ